MKKIELDTPVDAPIKPVEVPQVGKKDGYSMVTADGQRGVRRADETTAGRRGVWK